MATFGSFALLIALVLAAYNLLAGAVALRLLATGQKAAISPERLADTARRAGIAVFVAVIAAAVALVYSAFTNDFFITYITEHSNRALPGPYKFFVIWSWQGRSLFFLVLLLGPYAFMLYLGYVGFCVPFCFALGALMMRYPGEKWIRITRGWTMVAWLFLTCGIFLGMHWAYAVLGWGGYWGWDPVENASFMPWLTGTAFLHSVMMQEKKGMMKSWNVWLIFATFLLTMLGTLLTRAGLVSSVHAFAQSSIGVWFDVFMLTVLCVCIFTYVLQRSHLQSGHQVESLVSRESSFLFNNLVLLVACFVILWGTLFPILSEYVVGNKVTVGAPFYNTVAIPIGLFLVALTGVGPLLAWRSTSLRSVRRNFLAPFIAFWAMVIVVLAAGDRPYHDGAWDSAQFYALVAFSTPIS